MATYTFGGQREARTFTATEPQRVHVNRGKYRMLSDADEQLVDCIVNCKSYSEEIPLSDMQMIEEKHTGSGYGIKADSTSGDMITQPDGWQPETLGGQIIDLVRAKSKVRNYHHSFNAPSDPFELPVNLDDFVVSLDPGEGQKTPAGVQKITQNKVVFKHHKVMVETSVSTEFEEDSVPESMAFLKQLLAVNLAECEEDQLFFNHSEKGIIQNANNRTGASADSFSADPKAAVIGLLKQMEAPYNLDPANLVAYVHPTLYWGLVEHELVATQDKFGPKATVFTGEVGKYFGMSVAPITSLKSVTVDAEAYPLVIANRASVLLSKRRNLNIRVFPLEGDKNKIEATMRSAIAYPYGSKGVELKNFQA